MSTDELAGFEAASLAAEHWLANINTGAMFASNGLVEETVAVVQQVLDQCRAHSHVLNSPEVTTALALASDSAVSADGKLYPSAHHAALSLSQRWLHELWRCVDEAEGMLDWAYASHDEDRRFDPGRLRECDWRPIAEWMSGFCADHELELWSANIAVLILHERAAVESRPRPLIEHHSPEERPLVHSIDFASVTWNGTLYTFTTGQAACVKVLYEHWKKGTPVVGQEAIIDAADVQQELRYVFRDNPAWTTLIVSPSKGRFRLAEPTAKENLADGKTHG